MNTPVNGPAPAGDDDELEEFSDDFKCCVCLDLIYKPVVLACGHISCFWCVFEAMDTCQESRCPVCRHAYYHFPSICWLLHFVLLKLYPDAYRRRESQVTAVSHCNEQMPLQWHATGQGEDCSVRGSLEPALSDNNCTTGSPTSSSDKITKNVTVEGNLLSGNEYVDSQPAKQVPITDLLCAICKELLCRPVVLNCGHACIIDSCNEPCRCPVCRSMHPNGFPKVCLVLEGFLAQHVSEEYAARKVAIDKPITCEQGSSSTVSTQVPQDSQSVPMNDYLCSPDSKVHFGVGCDCCGMYPLIGDRYRCKDCFEEVGFDLCEDCYNSSSNLPGRFNQQHKPDHEFEVKEPKPMIILSTGFASDWHDPEPPPTNDTFGDRDGIGPT
ncbi:Zinc finger, RING/FYVE/PHD-type [Cynara cardunculus var. scolymus]|uniref:Zinc finger, RING/FYVE/PHD-type n=1 Tax=Cynara cardunculus var. scolymus TaxID=59895 RepID=A0A124SEL0_CYNCS|nr:Zinc finger, RING/FYVE/PHD-type [Cynara cardunculus var. scolymus]